MKNNKRLLQFGTLSIALLFIACVNTKKGKNTDSVFPENIENAICEFNQYIRKKRIYGEPDYYLKLVPYTRHDSCFIEIRASVSPQMDEKLYDVQGYTYVDSTLVTVFKHGTPCIPIQIDKLISYEEAMQIKAHEDYGLMIDDRIVWTEIYVHNEDSLLIMDSSLKWTLNK